jgi:hypothetical protein
MASILLETVEFESGTAVITFRWLSPSIHETMYSVHSFVRWASPQQLCRMLHTLPFSLLIAGANLLLHSHFKQKWFNLAVSLLCT